MISNILIAISLSFDSLAASVASGTLILNANIKHAFKIAIVFALFQGIMPVIGWLIGKSFEKYISAFDHWLAFILLTGISIKIIYDGLKQDADKDRNFNPLNNVVLITMAIATSIDALIVGVGLGILEKNILIPAAIIGFFTFLFSFLGVSFSNWLSKRLNNKIEIIGGLILFAIGVKILVEHAFI